MPSRGPQFKTLAIKPPNPEDIKPGQAPQLQFVPGHYYPGWGYYEGDAPDPVTGGGTVQQFFVPTNPKDYSKGGEWFARSSAGGTENEESRFYYNKPKDGWQPHVNVQQQTDALLNPDLTKYGVDVNKYNTQQKLYLTQKLRQYQDQTPIEPQEFDQQQRMIRNAQMLDEGIRKMGPEGKNIVNRIIADGKQNILKIDPEKEFAGIPGAKDGYLQFKSALNTVLKEADRAGYITGEKLAEGQQGGGQGILPFLAKSAKTGIALAGLEGLSSIAQNVINGTANVDVLERSIPVLIDQAKSDYVNYANQVADYPKNFLSNNIRETSDVYQEDLAKKDITGPMDEKLYNFPALKQPEQPSPQVSATTPVVAGTGVTTVPDQLEQRDIYPHMPAEPAKPEEQAQPPLTAGVVPIRPQNVADVMSLPKAPLPPGGMRRMDVALGQGPRSPADVTRWEAEQAAAEGKGSREAWKNTPSQPTQPGPSLFEQLIPFFPSNKPAVAPIQAGEPEPSPWSRYGTTLEGTPGPSVPTQQQQPARNEQQPDSGTENALPRLSLQDHVDQLAPGSRFVWHHDGEEYVKT